MSICARLPRQTILVPGTEEEKMGPWMGALDDNLEVLAKGDGSAGECGRA